MLGKQLNLYLVELNTACTNFEFKGGKVSEKLRTQS